MNEQTKSVPVSIRFPIELKNALDDAAYLVDRGVTSLVLEGVNIVLERIRAEHGDIPPRPRRQTQETATEPVKPSKRRGRKT